MKCSNCSAELIQGRKLCMRCGFMTTTSRRSSGFGGVGQRTRAGFGGYGGYTVMDLFLGPSRAFPEVIPHFPLSLAIVIFLLFCAGFVIPLLAYPQYMLQIMFGDTEGTSKGLLILYYYIKLIASCLFSLSLTWVIVRLTLERILARDFFVFSVLTCLPFLVIYPFFLAFPFIETLTTGYVRCQLYVVAILCLFIALIFASLYNGILWFRALKAMTNRSWPRVLFSYAVVMIVAVMILWALPYDPDIDSEQILYLSDNVREA